MKILLNIRRGLPFEIFYKFINNFLFSKIQSRKKNRERAKTLSEGRSLPFQIFRKFIQNFLFQRHQKTSLLNQKRIKNRRKKWKKKPSNTSRPFLKTFQKCSRPQKQTVNDSKHWNYLNETQSRLVRQQRAIDGSTYVKLVRRLAGSTVQGRLKTFSTILLGFAASRTRGSTRNFTITPSLFFSPSLSDFFPLAAE